MPTVNTLTVGATARDHSTPLLWEAATDNDLPEGDVLEQGEGYDDSNFSDSGGSIFLTGGTQDATRYRRLYAAAGQEFDPSDNSGCLYTGTATAIYVDNRDDFFRCERWGFINDYAGTDQTNCVFNHTDSSNSLWIACYFEMTATTSTLSLSQCWYTDSDTHSLYSCIARGDGGINDTGAQGGFYDRSHPVNFFSCLAYDIDNGTRTGGFYGIWALHASSVVQNCGARGSATTDFVFGGSTTHDHNASGDSSATGTGSVTGLSATAGTDFTDAPNGDFTVADADSILVDAGVDLSGTFTDAMDPANDHVATFEIGAYNFTAPDAIHPTYAERYEHTPQPNTLLRM